MQPDSPEPAPVIPRIREVIKAMFLEADWAEVEALIVQECGRNLPFCDDLSSGELDRFRLAALKLSGGQIDRLINAISVGQTDWRDLLMAAGFGEDVRAHLTWHPDQ